MFNTILVNGYIMAKLNFCTEFNRSKLNVFKYLTSSSLDGRISVPFFLAKAP